MKTIKAITLTLMLTFMFGSFSFAANEGTPGGNNWLTSWVKPNQKRVKFQNLPEAPISKFSEFSTEILTNTPGWASLSLESPSGEVVWGRSVELSNDINLFKVKIGNIPSGVYFLKVKGDSVKTAATIYIK